MPGRRPGPPVIACQQGHQGTFRLIRHQGRIRFNKPHAGFMVLFPALHPTDIVQAGGGAQELIPRGIQFVQRRKLAEKRGGKVLHLSAVNQSPGVDRVVGQAGLVGHVHRRDRAMRGSAVHGLRRLGRGGLCSGGRRCGLGRTAAFGAGRPLPGRGRGLGRCGRWSRCFVFVVVFFPSLVGVRVGITSERHCTILSGSPEN